MESQALEFSSRHPAFIDRGVYGTITMMSMLIIYDGWQDLRLIDVVGVIVGPVVAIFLGHMFSAALAREVVVARGLTGSEGVAIVRSQAPFLLLCVPPTMLVVILDLVGVSLADAIAIVLWMGVGSLGLWCGLAGLRAGFTGWRLVRSMLAGIVVGLVVLSLHVLVRPGTAR